jgi:pilus assembly protein Flp/PilA
MTKALNAIKRFSADEDGAALVEYTVLLGIMLVAVIATIVLVGSWINTKWVALYNAIAP